MSAPDHKAGKDEWSYLLEDFGPALREVLGVLRFGADKHGTRDAWKKRLSSDYLEAMYRHTMAGPGTPDPETGRLHAAHIAANALILLMMERQKVVLPKVEGASAHYVPASEAIMERTVEPKVYRYLDEGEEIRNGDQFAGWNATNFVKEREIGSRVPPNHNLSFKRVWAGAGEWRFLEPDEIVREGDEWEDITGGGAVWRLVVFIVGSYAKDRDRKFRRKVRLV